MTRPAAPPLSPVLVYAAPPSAASEASIAAYLAAGERAHMLAGIFALVCVALIVLTLTLTWALGLLPGTVKLV